MFWRVFWLDCGCMWAEARGQILLAWIYWTCCFTTAGLSRARLVLSVFSLQNRLASTRAELGGKTCSVAGPTQKPRAALGEIGNVAVINKDVTKKVKSFFFKKKSYINVFSTYRSKVINLFLGQVWCRSEGLGLFWWENVYCAELGPLVKYKMHPRLEEHS